MKIPHARDLPPRAAGVVLVLALLAGVVGGGEKPPGPPPAATAAKQTAAEEPVAAEDLALDALARVRSDRERQDLFASRSWAPPPAPPPAPAATKAAPSAAPSAPPLPFRYLGRKADTEKLVVYLVKGEDTYNASVGDTLDNAYSVEGVSETAVQFIYLPLGTKHVLSIPQQ